MNPIVINGTVLCDPITGIPRFVYEVVTRLDPLLEGTGLDVRLCYRDDGRPLHIALAPQPVPAPPRWGMRWTRCCLKAATSPPPTPSYSGWM